MKNLKIKTGLHKNFPCIYMVRHGETEWNGDVKKIRGWENILLNENGVKQAESVSKAFTNIDISKIYSSDLKRCVNTARIIRNKVGPSIRKTSCLRPWDLGIYTGKAVDDIIDKLEYYSKNPDEVVPDGESFNNFKDRLIGCLENITSEFLINKKNIIIVTHYRVVELVKVLLKNKSLRNKTGGIYTIGEKK